MKTFDYTPDEMNAYRAGLDEGAAIMRHALLRISRNLLEREKMAAEANAASVAHRLQGDGLALMQADADERTSVRYLHQAEGMRLAIGYFMADVRSEAAKEQIRTTAAAFLTNRDLGDEQEMAA